MDTDNKIMLIKIIFIYWVLIVILCVFFGIIMARNKKAKKTGVMYILVILASIIGLNYLYKTRDSISYINYYHKNEESYASIIRSQYNGIEPTGDRIKQVLRLKASKDIVLDSPLDNFVYDAILVLIFVLIMHFIADNFWKKNDSQNN